MIERYLESKIALIFSDQEKYKRWAKIELLSLKHLTKKGFLNKKKYLIIKNSISIDSVKIAAEETIIKHDFNAFLNVLLKDIKITEKKWIHFGLTTNDVVDTANALAIKEVNEIILKEVYLFLKILKTTAYKYKNLTQIARTHGVHAEINSFGYKFAIFYDDIKNWLKIFYTIKNQIEVAKISGSVGNFANTSIELQDYIAGKLNLISSKSSTQVISRERYYHYLFALNSLGQTINKISTNLRSLARSEINEINESFDEKFQVGSSSMPHKKNPITLENICGLSRLLKGFAVSSMDNISLWDERDISHSSFERVALLDSTTLIYNMIKKISNFINNMKVNEQDILKNIKLSNKNIFSQNIMMKLIEKSSFSREEIHTKIKEMTFESHEKNIDLKTIFKKHKLSDNFLDKEIDNIFNENNYLKNIDKIYDKIFYEDNLKEQLSGSFFEEGEIKNTITLLSDKINNYYQNNKEQIIVLTILDGALVFAGQILTQLNINLKLKTISLKNYGNHNFLNNESKIKFSFNKKDFENKKVLILEDLLDQGHTLNEVISKLKECGTADIKIAVLFKKNNEQNKEIKIDWVGKNVADEWVIGYGLDSANNYRNLPFLSSIKKK